MNRDRLLLLTPLREALERIERKAAPLLADPITAMELNPSAKGAAADGATVTRWGSPVKDAQAGETVASQVEQMGLGL